MSVMKGDVSTEKGSAGSEVSELMSVNGLSYRMPEYLNVCSKRSLVRNYFDKSVYKVDTGNMVCILNAGDAFVDAKNSYLTFKVVITSQKTAHFGTGSAINCINRVVLSTEAGVEIERVEGVNVLQHALDHWNNSENWKTSQGSVIGYHGASEDCRLTFAGAAAEVKFDRNLTGDTDEIGASSIIVKGNKDYEKILATTQYIIPLSHLAGLFTSDQLLPGLGLMSKSS